MSTVDNAVEQGVAVSRPPRLLARMMRQRQAKVGMVLTLAVLLVALAGPLLLPWLTGHTSTEFTGRPFTDTGMFGTDNLGRDVLSRFLDGGLRLIIYAALATALGMVVGVAVGMTAAYSRGRVDALIMRGNDVLLALPQLVFALLAITVLGPQGWVLVVVIGITHAPRIARVTRSATASVITEDYIRASEMYAAPKWKILLTEVLPNITGPLMVELGLRMTYSIGFVAALSFLGLGMQPPTADWGLMINESRIALVVQPWGVLLPVAAIAVLTVGTNLLTDSLARASANMNAGN
ncbi:ABC transporter permease [Paeniglutamicibacter psychrophenolicus]|uniref:Peptide/nickel transport system permease protein n=1 Tax=Paeniglutamicibacter psychrophenolicus TaxID=257454 RepID=A0ABS4WFK9_9MICC|nr:ABC transporter permease [Paeniglutamicibacter psychrophenolicus]MBP2374983.1 peptide/nickel transport system permease protein [Paeniglutamicibacter psychrophenolicus]